MRFQFTIVCLVAMAALSFSIRSEDGNGKFFPLTGAAGLPKYVRATPGGQRGGSDKGVVLADESGLRGGEVRTLATDYFTRDFVFDAVVQFKNIQDNGTGYIGIGENGREGGWTLNSVMVHLVGPGRAGAESPGGMAEVVTHKNPYPPKLGKLPNVGPHLVRLEKKGNELTTSIYANFDEAAGVGAKPDFTHTISDLAKDAPYLTRLNSALFFGGAVTFKALRLSVDGKFVDPGPHANAGFKDVTTSADLVKLTAGGRLPAFMEQSKTAAIGRDGLALGPGSGPGPRGGSTTVRTRQGNFLSKNFTFDVVYRFKPGERAIMLAGMGANRRDGGNWFLESVGSRVHGPGYDGDAAGKATVSFHSFFDDTIFARLGTDHLGPNLFRIQKRGNTLTFAICVDFQGEFKPDYSATVPDLKNGAPTLDDKACYLFVGEGGTVEQMRLVIDGEAVESVALEYDLPEKITAGTAFKQKVVKDVGTRRFSIQNPPAGLTLTPDGVLTWTPAPDQVGKHELKIAVFDKGRSSPQPVELEVVPGAAVARPAVPAAENPAVRTRPAANITGEMRAAATKLTGNWDATVVLDDAKLAAMLKQQGVPADKMPASVELLKKNLAGLKMALVFRADGTGESVVSGMGNKPESSGGKWEVTEAKGGSVKISLADKDGKAVEIALIFAGQDRFAAVLPEELAGPMENPVTFRRGVPPAPVVAPEIKIAMTKLVGVWDATIVFDDAKLAPVLKQQGVAADKMPAALELLKKNMAGLKMAFVFRADGTGESIVSGMGPKPEINGGKWEVLEAMPAAAPRQRAHSKSSSPIPRAKRKS